MRSLGPGRLLALGTILLGFLVFFSFVASRALDPGYALLYAELMPEDAKVIADRLRAQDVPFKLNDRGDAIMVPQDQIGRLRMDLASEGMPAGSVTGYEIFDQSGSFGQTDFLSNVNLRRAMEGELARSISTLKPVRSARVHIVQPERSLFRRDEARPTASVVLSLRGGARLDGRQVQAIRNLVAAAVPGLEPTGITIIDDRGNLLARSGEAAESGLFPGEADELRSGYEARIKAKIVQLLERSVGPGRVDAEVTVEMNFDQVTTTAETFDPQGQVARSTQTVEEQSDRNETEANGTVSVTNNLPTSQPAGGAAGGTSERNNRSEETVNFEISRTVRNEVQRPGGIRRLSIAVQVDGVQTDQPDGSVSFTPRSPEELAELESLAKSAAGFDETRGDVFQIASRRFLVAETLPELEPGLIEQLGLDGRRLIELGLLSVLTLAVVFFGVRPLLNRLLPEPEVQTGSALAGADDGRLMITDQRADPQAARPVQDGPDGETEAAGRGKLTDLTATGSFPGPLPNLLLQEVTRIVEDRPQDAVKVIRAWLEE
ncbi:MAG TPA: flagellar basal-body MS-ring/collar protein FliF [Geminicoccus sp.]|uniref:flagellar basal-body MS-ring/collar protein FliF n=1 Tax=Geminicoccus sp. TaxID=2024832 RepID=UPI002E30B8B4|nr:flagellar basal-body MS-ring/collar protein FliF [Geminicoccus sp.]HEX2525618.1 flagellar basal-body MS-ring/collar protein FliF [Geminicoccus sp.]